MTCDCEKKAGEYIRDILGGHPLNAGGSPVDALIESHRHQRDLVGAITAEAHLSYRRLWFLPKALRRWVRGL